MASSLSSVVSNLVRASMGTSVSNTVTDEELDRHVAELIVREAKKKAERYSQQGIRAYISNNMSDSNAPKTNKRFLTSIIKSTDDHNKTILKAQATAAQEVKREREEQERRQRRARAEEAAEAERLRRKGLLTISSSSSKKRRRASPGESWDRWDGRTAKREKVSRNWESWDGRDSDGELEEEDHEKRRRRDDTRPENSSRRTHDDEADRNKSRRRSRERDNSLERVDDDYKRRKRRRSRSRERSHKHSRRSRSRSRSPVPTEQSKSHKHGYSHSPNYATDKARNDMPPRRTSPTPDPTLGAKEKLPKNIRSTESRVSSPKPNSGPPSRRSPLPSISRSPSPGPQLPVQLPSKMDRYFEESYDPRLDVAPLQSPRVPATGLIDNAEFEGWDAMLELIRIRQQDKEEKRRMERLGLLPKDKDKTKSKKKVDIDSAPAVADRWGSTTVSIMDIEYKKKGAVREWDLGKEGF